MDHLDLTSVTSVTSVTQVVWVFKPIGWNPADCVVEYLRLNKDTLLNKKIAFAGRLDPIACGLLPLIITDKNENKDRQNKKESLQSSYKTYRFSLISGLKSDSFDIMGITEKRDKPFDHERFITEDIIPPMARRMI